MEDCPKYLTPEILDLRLKELEKRFALHMEYQKEDVIKTARELKEKLLEMNEFREENRRLTGQFATTVILDERTQMLNTRIEVLNEHIESGIGKRLTALEMYKANLDGRFWVWGIFITILTLVLQFWPMFRK